MHSNTAKLLLLSFAFSVMIHDAFGDAKPGQSGDSAAQGHRRTQQQSNAHTAELRVFAAQQGTICNDDSHCTPPSVCHPDARGRGGAVPGSPRCGPRCTTDLQCFTRWGSVAPYCSTDGKCSGLFVCNDHSHCTDPRWPTCNTATHRCGGANYCPLQTRTCSTTADCLSLGRTYHCVGGQCNVLCDFDNFGYSATGACSGGTTGGGTHNVHGISCLAYCGGASSSDNHDVIIDACCHTHAVDNCGTQNLLGPNWPVDTCVNSPGSCVDFTLHQTDNTV